jgi:membrane protein implicated in regulation of membrane protease activity
MNARHWPFLCALAPVGVLAWVIGAAKALAAIWGPILAAATVAPTLWLVIVVVGVLTDRRADRRREERWGRIIETKAIDQ